MSIWDAPYIGIFFGVIAFMLGAVMGSFLNCAAWRIAHGQSFIKGRSMCPDCGAELGLPDLVPIFSWLFLKGKCRHCGKKIPVRYFLTELFFALLTLGCLLRFDLTVICLRNYIFLCCLFCLSLVDIDIFEIPNGTVIIPAVAWLAAVPFEKEPLKALITGLAAGVGLGVAMLLLSLLLDRILKKDTLGGGDIKLLAVVGLYFGPFGSLFTLIISCVIGLIFAAIFKKKRDGEGHFPFGPSIALASALMLFIGGPLVDAYMKLFGI
ncbi:MAG: prepilin peptidase [Clostridia bacterium]|nr:prepilin peptidase [Clostridia bacterium]